MRERTQAVRVPVHPKDGWQGGRLTGSLRAAILGGPLVFSLYGVVRIRVTLDLGYDIA